MTAPTSERVRYDNPPFPPYPKTDRQAELMQMADDLAAIAAEQADAHDRDNTFPFDTFAALKEAATSR